MRDIHCPKDIGFENTFEGEECEREQHYNNCYHCWASAIACAFQKKRGKCSDCKHFEYDSVAIVDGIPLIVAHEICKKWGDGCKTKEDGYCFMFEEKEE